LKLQKENTILQEWMKEFMFQSSELNPKKWCKRKDIERIESILNDYFGEEFFSKETVSRKSDNEVHLIFWLLNQKTKTSLTSLFEYVHLIEYSMNLSTEIQKKLRSNIKNSEQFQNLMFEIYTYRLLDFNNIENEKGTRKGNQELEGHCTINDKKFLYECRKSYSVLKSIFKDILDIIDSLYSSMKVRNEYIGYIRIKEFCGATKEELRKVFKDCFGQFRLKNAVIIYEYECKHLKFETKLYNTENLAEYNLISEDDLIKFRCYIGKENTQKGMNIYQTEILPQISHNQKRITDKLIKTINKKRKQHRNSKDENRIIFIDCEINNYLNFPLLTSEQVIDKNEISDYLNSKNTKDIVVIILRNYLPVKPEIKIITFGDSEFENEMEKIRELKTNFSVKQKNGIIEYGHYSLLYS